MAIPNTNMAKLAEVKLPILKRLKSMIGSFTLSSTTKNRIVASTVPPNRERIGVELQPQSFPWIMASTRQNMAALKVMMPGKSMRLLTPGSRVSGTNIATMKRPMMQNGKFTKKIQRQSKFCTR